MVGQVKWLAVSRVGDIKGHQGGFTSHETVGRLTAEMAETNFGATEYRGLDLDFDTVVIAVIIVAHL